MAIWTGAAMHGHALASFALAFVDRGGLYTPGPLSLTGGTGVFLLGAFVIYLGRRAYGDQARVYGLKEDVLIEQGIYRRLVCSLKSGPLFELVPASDMELRHGQEIYA